MASAVGSGRFFGSGAHAGHAILVLRLEMTGVTTVPLLIPPSVMPMLVTSRCKIGQSARLTKGIGLEEPKQNNLILF